MTHLGSPYDEYELIKQIGDGSFGIVYKARNKNTRKCVAIKVMKKKYSCLEDCNSQFEPKLLKLLPPHLNIVQMFDSFLSSTENLAFVMEYMDGGNLYQLMRERKQCNMYFNHCEQRNILHQILSAVSHIHHHNIFHRDMKPENLLIDYSTGRPLIKLADFGLARELNSSPPYTEYVSTRWYRAPEVLLRATEYSASVDLWALGVIFAELIMLEPLFPGESEIDQMFRICEILGSPGNKTGVIGQNTNRLIRPEKRISPGFARKKQKEIEQISISTVSTVDTGNEWKEGVKLAYKIGFKFPHFTPKPLGTVIQNATKSMLDIIQHFLFFNPQQRRSADAALHHPFFTETLSIHSSTHNEPVCPEWDKEHTPYGIFCSAVKEDPLSTNHIEPIAENDMYLNQHRPIYSSHKKGGDWNKYNALLRPDTPRVEHVHSTSSHLLADDDVDEGYKSSGHHLLHHHHHPHHNDYHLRHPPHPWSPLHFGKEDEPCIPQTIDKKSTRCHSWVPEDDRWVHVL